VLKGQNKSSCLLKKRQGVGQEQALRAVKDTKDVDAFVKQEEALMEDWLEERKLFKDAPVLNF
jgi:hypothetical protein